MPSKRQAPDEDGGHFTSGAKGSTRCQALLRAILSHESALTDGLLDSPNGSQKCLAPELAPIRRLLARLKAEGRLLVIRTKVESIDGKTTTVRAYRIIDSEEASGTPNLKPETVKPETGLVPMPLGPRFPRGARRGEESARSVGGHVRGAGVAKPQRRKQGRPSKPPLLSFPVASTSR